MGAGVWPVMRGWLTNPEPPLPSLVTTADMCWPLSPCSCHHWPALATPDMCLTTDQWPLPSGSSWPLSSGDHCPDVWCPLIPLACHPSDSLSPLFVMQIKPLSPLCAPALCPHASLECRWSVLKWNGILRNGKQTRDWINYWSDETWNLHHLAPRQHQSPRICPVTPARAQNNSCPVWSWLAIGKCSPY